MIGVIQKASFRLVKIQSASTNIKIIIKHILNESTNNKKRKTYMNFINYQVSFQVFLRNIVY